MDRKTYHHIHFIGIKGVGMTAMAIFAKEKGIKVTGSDVLEEFVTDEVLKRHGIIPRIGFGSDNLIGKPDLVIVTGAHGALTNPEAQAAQKMGLPVIMQGQAVGLFMEGKKGISVCGVGGKTTTSAIIATILTRAGCDPSFIIGCGDIFTLGSPGHAGRGDYFIAEADEYSTVPQIDKTPKFLWQNPKHIVVTNIEFDHPDVYENIGQTKEAYLKFFKKIPRDGSLIACADNKNIREVITSVEGNIQTYGISPDASWQLKGFHRNCGNSVFWIEHKRITMGQITLKVPGRHNALNALGAAVVGFEMGLSFKEIKHGLETFTGTKRRFEFVGKKRGVLFYDDYAHHPNEIQVILETARESFDNKNIIVIFQPHTYSRTLALLNQFSRSFQKASDIIITDIYSSKREIPDSRINGVILAAAIRKFNPNTYFLKKLEDIVRFVVLKAKKGDIVLTLGAGDIYKWGKIIMEDMRESD